MQAKGYIFDFGGTIDTDGCHWGKALWHAYERVEVPVSEQEFRDAYVFAERQLSKSNIILPDYTFKMTLDTKISIELDYLREHSQWHPDDSDIGRYSSMLLDSLYADVENTIGDNKSVLSALSDSCPLVLVTNFYGNTPSVLKEFGLEGYFVGVVDSTLVGVRKPDPRIFEIGVQRLGISPREIVSVGDSFYKDVVPSKKVGMSAVWLQGEGWTDKEYDESVPDRIIYSLKELIG